MHFLHIRKTMKSCVAAVGIVKNVLDFSVVIHRSHDLTDLMCSCW